MSGALRRVIIASTALAWFSDAVAQNNHGVINGGVTENYLFTNYGTINGNVLNFPFSSSQNQFINLGPINGAVTNNTLPLLADQTFPISGNFLNASTITGTVRNVMDNPGYTPSMVYFSNDGTINGLVVNSATFNNTGTITNGVLNSTANGITGSATFNNTGSIAGGVTNSAIFQNAVGGTITGGVWNNGTFNNSSGTITGGVSNYGTFNNSSGTITGGVSNRGTFNNSSGTITGGVSNYGTFNNDGAINGNVTSIVTSNFIGNDTLFRNNRTGTINGNVTVGCQSSNYFSCRSKSYFINNGTVKGDVSIDRGGRYEGNGTITGDLINLGGEISPGNSIGTVTIGGNYGHMSGGTHIVEVNGSGQSDLIVVGGTASLQGGTVSVSALPGAAFAPRTTYTILTAAGGISGAYASVVDPYPFLLTSLSYDANNAYLTLQIGGFAAAAANANQAAVGQVLDANVFTAGGDFAQVLNAMAINTLSSSQAQMTLTALSGQNYSTFSSTMVQGVYLFLNNFANQTGGGGSPASTPVALAEACDVACDVAAPARWGAWGGALGGLGTIGANTGTGAVTYNAGGFAAGLDRQFAPGFRAGVTAGYTTGTQWTADFTGQGTTDTFLAGLYGNYRQDKFYTDGVLGYAYSYNQMWRQIFIPGLQPRTAQGRTGANQWYGQVEGGYRFDIGTAADAYITPFLRWQGYTGAQNGFTETGAQSLNLTVAGQTTDSLRSVLGAQLGGAIDLGWREKLALQFRLGWSHEYASTARPVTATLEGAPLMPFTTYGISPTRDGAVVGFSSNTAVADGLSAYIRYEGIISGSDSAHALTAGIRMIW